MSNYDRRDRQDETAMWDAGEVRRQESAQQQRRGDEKRRSARRRTGTAIYLVCVVLGSCLLAGIGWLMINDLCSLNKAPVEVEITVDEGDSVSDVAKKLKDAGLVNSKGFFQLASGFLHYSRYVEPGTYKLNSDMDFRALIVNMHDWKQDSMDAQGLVQVTIPEGYTVRQIIDLLAEKGVATKAELEDACANFDFENYYDLSTRMFFSAMLPPFILSTVLILLCCLAFPKDRLSVPEVQVTVDSRQAAVYGGLFCLAVAMVLRLVPYVLGLTVIVLALWFLDRHALKTVDWGLLATFAAFFTFSGNLARMEPVRVLFARLLSHGTMLISALTCQIISNVPAAILLSRFTQDARALLVGVNVGGAGTLVASLASLITFREYTRRVPNGGKSFLLLFSGISFAFLAILLTVMSIPM